MASGERADRLRDLGFDEERVEYYVDKYDNVLKDYYRENTVIECKIFLFNEDNRSEKPYESSEDNDYLQIDDNRKEYLKKIWTLQTKYTPYNRKKKKEDPQFSEDKYMAVSSEEMNKLLQNFYNICGQQIINKKWYDDKKPNFEEKDPVFAQKVVINNPKAKIVMIGDVHSSLHSLADIIVDIDYMFENDSSWELKKDNYIVFLGDLVDRGPYSIEVLFTALLLKIKNEDNVFIINGNHEDKEQYKMDGTEIEINKQFQWELQNDDKYANFNKKLYFLPSVIYLTFNENTYHLSHGGVDVRSFTELYAELIDEEKEKDKYSTYNDNKSKYFINFLNNKEDEFLLVNDHNKMSGFKWSDFHQELSYYGANRGYVTNAEDTKKYLDLLGIECIISGHQDKINLGLLIDGNYEDNATVTFNNIKFIRTNNRSDYKEHFYDLFSPEPNTGNIIVKPNDFLALITSTANITRPTIKGNTYLIMSIKDN